MKTKNLIYLVFLLIFSSCLSDEDVEEGKFPLSPTNFESINSEYDDYNSALPSSLYNEVPFLFSSNRNSQGGQFDIISFGVEFFYLPDQDKVYFDIANEELTYFDPAIEKINTSANEFGPYITYTLDYLYDLFLYSTDSSGNLDIYYTYNNVYENKWADPKPLSKINSEYNDAYPTFNKTRDEFYFCSDEKGTYDLYKVVLTNASVINWFSTEEAPQKVECTLLNSDANDKCPSINRNLMVFASNREGGFGGYDLYYSEYVNGAWTAPVNFGSSINTEFDEYRPVTLYANNYINDVMIFSSNRTGGKGGFDLYYVGIPKMIKP